jgi:hypothetical protein
VLPRRPSDDQNDTDPSTPGALRGPDGSDLKASTDPGIGPPSRPAMAVLPPIAPPPHHPLGIVVPVPVNSPVGPKKDSVELLLDGITNPQPERTKTTPQTDGQASASYHAEHYVQAARTSPDDEPKVVVDRPPQAATIRLDRGKVQNVIAAADAYNARREMEATAVLPQPMAPRVIIALVAGLLVVLGIFLVARLSVSRSQAAAAGSSLPAATATTTTPDRLANVPPPPPATATPTDTTSAAAASPPVPPVPPAPPPPVMTATATPGGKPPFGGGPAGNGKPKPRSTAPAPGSTATDLGEFKTKF